MTSSTLSRFLRLRNSLLGSLCGMKLPLTSPRDTKAWSLYASQVVSQSLMLTASDSMFADLAGVVYACSSDFRFWAQLGGVKGQTTYV